MLSLSDKPIREIYVGYNPAPGGFCNAVLFCRLHVRCRSAVFGGEKRIIHIAFLKPLF